MNADKWFVRVSGADDASERLLCFPHAGGGAATFNPWRASFPDDIEVIAVRLPGRETRLAEQPVQRLSTLVETMLPLVEASLGNKPLSLFGHCSGALVALRVAQAMDELASPARKLFVSGQGAPHLASNEVPVSGLPSDQFRAYIRQLGGMDEEILANDEFMEMIEPAIRADFALGETAGPPGLPLSCQIIAFGTSHDPLVPVEALRAWAQLTTAAFECTIFQGDGHFFGSEAWQSIANSIVRRRLSESRGA